MQSRYDAVLAALSAGVVIHGADTEILDANDRARELLGLKDLEGRLATDPDWVFLEADGTPMTLERFPVMQVLATRQELHGLSMVIRPPRGPDVWLEVSAAPIVDGDGRLHQVAVTFIDVTDRKAAEDALAAAEAESRLAFDRAMVPTCLVANDGRIIRVNPAMCDLLGRSQEELLSLTFLDVTHPEDVHVGLDRLGDLLAGRVSSVRLSKRYVTGSGRTIWGDVTISAVRDEDGDVRHRIAQIIDITAEHGLRASLEEASRIAHLGVWSMDLETGHVEWSAELYPLFGLEPSETAPDFAAQRALFTPESWDRLTAAVAETQATGAGYTVEVEVVRADGAHRWAEARGEAVRNASGDIVELHGISVDITDRKVARDELEVLATRDSLTGLANRAVLVDEITRAIRSGRRSERSTAVLMMDLDRFKAINDTMGHAVGDELLIEAARRLGEVVRASDLVARLGGDEFVVVMRDLAEPTEAVRAAERLVQAFQAPFVIGERELYATASVGVAISVDGAEAGDLLREADTALYAAKGAGRDRLFLYNEDLRTAVATRMQIEADLRHALNHGELEVWYQPEVDLATGTVIAAEALLRWHHPDGSLWGADRFIDVAEDTGLILDIGDWVLRRACLEGARWAAARPESPLTVRVNVSTVQLAEAGLMDAVDDALTSSGLDPALLCVEITETALMQRTATATANLSALHSRGVSLAIDDFGTGYASLTYLNEYPIDVIKIDRSFVADTGHDHSLVAGIIALAGILGISVTAEGVEVPEQARRLRQMGCPSAQGWLYSPAVPAEGMVALVDHRYPQP